MNEEKFIAIVMETQKRVEQLEQYGFTSADRERIEAIFNFAGETAVEIKDVKEEIGHVNATVKRIVDKLDVMDKRLIKVESR